MIIYEDAADSDLEQFASITLISNYGRFKLFLEMEDRLWTIEMLFAKDNNGAPNNNSYQIASQW